MTANDAAELAAQWADLEARRTHIVDRQDTIKTQLRELLGVGKHAAGPLTVTVTPQRRFNPDLAREVLPASLLEAITLPTVSTAAAREILAPALYTACMTEVGCAPKVSIR